MKKYIFENNDITFWYAEDGLYHVTTQDSDEVFHHFSQAVAEYYTLVMNSVLAVGYKDSFFLEESHNIKADLLHMPTLEMKKYEKDFSEIKKQAYKKGELPPMFNKYYEINAFNSMQLEYKLYAEGLHTKEDAEKNTKIFFNAYVNDRKMAESVKNEYLLQQERIKAAEEKLTQIVKTSNELTSQLTKEDFYGLLDTLLDVVSALTGEKVTANIIKMNIFKAEGKGA